MEPSELRYLELLSHSFPTLRAAAAEAMALGCALATPKGTELFASDIHGEHAAFSHLVRSGAGALRRSVDEAFDGVLSAEEQAELAALACYPREKASLALATAEDGRAWLTRSIEQLATLCRHAAAARPRAQVREMLPSGLAGVMEELLAEGEGGAVAERRRAAVDAALDAGCGPELVEALGQLAQRLHVDRLHVVGDVYDRGPAPDAIMDELAALPNLDIQWGNHDIVWMGAALGQRGCIAHVVRNCARYGNLSILEDSYGINLRPLAAFAEEAYGDDPCVAFGLKGDPALPEAERTLCVKIQKAMAIIQFKVEGQIIDDNPGFGLEDRKLLHRIDHEHGTVVVDGITYELTDTRFPTVDPSDPYRLTPGEEAALESLEQAFLGSERLQRHMGLFLEKGSLYQVRDGNLLIHAGVPMNEDGSLMEVGVLGGRYRGRALYDLLEQQVRLAFRGDGAERAQARDLLWWLWLAPGSPLFAKSKMATFELYLIADKAARKEVKNPFYALREEPGAMAAVFEDFGMDPATSRIICGHVPVKAKDGESPVKGAAQVIAIDGGFSAAYQPTTGVAGYTLTSDAEGLTLAAHGPLESRAAAIERNADVPAERQVIEQAPRPLRVADTDEGAALRQRRDDLERLMAAYREGLIAERA